MADQVGIEWQCFCLALKELEGDAFSISVTNASLFPRRCRHTAGTTGPVEVDGSAGSQRASLRDSAPRRFRASAGSTGSGAFMNASSTLTRAFRKSSASLTRPRDRLSSPTATVSQKAPSALSLEQQPFIKPRLEASGKFKRPLISGPVLMIGNPVLGSVVVLFSLVWVEPSFHSLCLLLSYLAD